MNDFGFLCLLSDVSSRNALVSVARRGADRCLQNPAHQLFSFKLLGFCDTEEVKYRRTKFGIVPFIYYMYVTSEE